MTKQELIDFEKDVALLFESGQIKCPIHLSGGNEDQLIEIFKGIAEDDYVFSTWRNHLHYLLHTGDKDGLMEKILAGDSMHTCSPSHNFYSSSIVGGTVAIATGVAMALKRKHSEQKVVCFVGDGGCDEGFFWEALRYAQGQDLNLTFVVENNDRSVETSIKNRWGELDNWVSTLIEEDKIMYYEYRADGPHCGIGKHVQF